MGNNEQTGKEKLEEKVRAWEAAGKNREEITYGMLCDGFQSIEGIPDDFYSAEDPADRAELWRQQWKSYCGYDD